MCVRTSYVYELYITHLYKYNNVVVCGERCMYNTKEHNKIGDYVVTDSGFSLVFM